MYTQCPHCLTNFRVRAEQLSAAEGQVHCGRCNQIFNALDSLQDSGFPETPEPERQDSLSDGASPPPPMPAESEASGDDVDNISLSQLFEDRVADDALVEHYGNRETAPELETSPPNDTDPAEAPFSQEADEPQKTDRTLDSDDAAGDITEPPFESLSEPSEPASPEADTGEDRVEDNLNDIPLDEGEIPTTNKSSGGAMLGWAFGILLLLSAALAQFTWLERSRLQEYPGVRQALEQVCGLVGCRLEPRRAPERIKILDRSVTNHPTIADALQIQVIFSNKAAFRQPYPKLRLGLYSTNNELVAQRLFNPDEYLADGGGSEHSLLRPDQQVQVDMALEDPGDTVTGFRFDFF